MQPPTPRELLASAPWRRKTLFARRSSSALTRRQCSLWASDSSSAVLAAATTRELSVRLAGAVDDEVHRVLTGHVLLAKEPYGGAFCLGEHGHQHIRAGNLLAAGRLDVDRGALNDALKGSGRSGVVAIGVHQSSKLVVDVVGEILF